MNVLVFNIKNYRFGISIDFLERVLEKQQTIYQVPCVPSFISGIVNYQGRIITVIDLGTFFKIGDDAEKNFILISKNNSNLGFMVKSLEGFRKLEQEELEDAAKFELDKEKREFVKYLAKNPGEVPICLIDTDILEGYIKNPQKWSK